MNKTRADERKHMENPSCHMLKGVAGNSSASHLERRMIYLQFLLVRDTVYTYSKT
jgi:hypothetical protein